MTRIAHIADTHIRNIGDHKLYEHIFNNLYKRLRKEKVDMIIHAGDIFHSKINLSPESVRLAGSFFKSLSDIAPTFCILGNHDCLISNAQRMNSIYPLEELIDNQNFHFYDNSDVYDTGLGIDLYVHSVQDTGSFPDLNIVDENKINIALFHGVVSGSLINEKFQLSGVPLQTFDKFDYTFLGDIHISNLILDKKGKIRYPGSTIQQNFGESEEKGFLLWDIIDKDEYKCEFIPLKNPKPFITIKVNKDIRNYDFDGLPKEAKIRFINDSVLDNNKFKKLVYQIKNKYKLKNITVLEQSKTQDLRRIDENTTVDNLHDINVHEKLLKTYFKDEKKEILDKILEYNKNYFNQLTNLETSKINRWEITDFKWDNLFNYGAKNSINFQNLNGVVGIFGKNRSGKSSVIDSMLFTIFNKISKNVKSNQEYVNSSKKEASGEITLKIDNNVYNITRKIEKNKSAKSSTSLQLKINNIINNDSSRIETDKYIQKLFGTLENFLLTSISSQFGSNNFIDEGSTKRKEILANFLELEIFDSLYELAKDDFSYIKSTIKKLETKNFSLLLKENKENIEQYIAEKENLEKELLEISKNLEDKKVKYITLSNIVKNITEYEDGYFDKLNKTIKQIEDEISKGEEFIITTKENYTNNKNKIIDINSVISSYDVENSKNIIEKSKKKIQELMTIIRKIEILNVKKEELEKNSKLLEDVPCKGSYNCKFLTNAKNSVEELKIISLEIEELLKNKLELKNEIELMDVDGHKNAISEHQDVLESLVKAKRYSESLLHSIEKEILLNKDRKNKLNQLLQELVDYKNNEKNIEKIKEIKNISMEKQELENELAKINKILQKNNEVIYKTKNTIEKLEEEKKNYDDLINNYSIFEKYIKAVSSGGIPFTIIRNKLGIINQKLDSYLKELVNFEVFFEDIDNNLYINIKDSNGIRAINMASGSEKMLASMAIRLSLLSISNLPRSNIFVLDEPGTALDSDNLDNFIKMLEMIKQDFSTIMLISHIEALKDCCDQIIDITNINGEAKVSI